MLLKFGLVLSEVGAVCFRWCALCSWGKNLSSTQSVFKDHHTESLYGPHAQLLLWVNV